MRIVAGSYRHRLIDYPKDSSTRPTMDRVREAFMSALGQEVVGRKVLDLFSGSGALGLEALSRGAISCHFVDSSKEAIRIIKGNIAKLAVHEKTVVKNESYTEFLKENLNQKFDLVFLDPPYIKKEVYEEVFNFMNENGMLEQDCIFVCESDIELGENPHFDKYKHYKYGIVHVNIYWRY